MKTVMWRGHEIEFNEEFQKALDLMNGDNNVLITGRAGTGKSTLLAYFRSTTKKNVAVLAPTGMAAVNVKGQTIHSFFRFKPDITPMRVKKLSNTKLYESLDAIVIDEVSMVRADLLDCVDAFLRRNVKNKPFGGVQMILIGDLYQLAPVVQGEERKIFRTQYASPYFFDPLAFKQMKPDYVELERIYRQKDQRFIELLNAIRHNTATEQQLEKLNAQYLPAFEPPDGEFYITLTATNAQADEINERHLARLPGKIWTSYGEIRGSFSEDYLPTVIELNAKVGAQIMLLNNDAQGRWVNGTVGKIVGIEPYDDEDVVIVELEEGEKVEVARYKWAVFQFFFNSETNSLDSQAIGSFIQYPFRLAWAVTIHKSQGKTFDRVVVDVGNGLFAAGQLYVALSRCRTLEGLVLKKPLEKKHIFMDWRVAKFLTRFQYQRSEQALSLEEKVSLIQNAVKQKSSLEITYLKPNDVKSKRVIRPKYVGELEYLGKKYVGVKAFCEERRDERTFRVDRILSARALPLR